METYRLPIQDVVRFFSVDRARLVERDGQMFWKVDANSELPSREGRPPGPARRPPPIVQSTLWFTTDTFRLSAMITEIPLPGRRFLSVRANYEAVGSLDVPVRRIVEGTIPLRRRDRMFAVVFKQVTDYDQYQIVTK
jgi:hypothetical protein